MAARNGYRHLTVSRVRFADLDAMGHLNNVALLEVLETARVNYMVDLSLGSHNQLHYALVSLHCDFRAQGFFGEELTCGTRAARIGRSSFVLEHDVWKDDGTIVASASSTFAALAEDKQRSAPVPDHWRRRLEEFEGRSLSATT